MSRAKPARVNGHRLPKGPFRSLEQRPPFQQQLDVLAQGLDRMSYLLSELDLQIEFVMRQIRLSRPKAGGIITAANGKPEMQVISLLELYETQREAFAAQVLQERQVLMEMARENARTEAAGDSPDSTPGASPSPEPGTDHPTGPSLVIVPGTKGD